MIQIPRAINYGHPEGAGLVACYVANPDYGMVDLVAGAAGTRVGSADTGRSNDGTYDSYFDGNGDSYTFTANRHIFVGTPFTIAAEVRLDAFVDSYPALMTLFINDGGASGYSILYSNDPSYSDIHFGHRFGAVWALCKTGTLTGTTVTGARHWLVITYNGGTATTLSNFSCYVNGIPQTLSAGSVLGAYPDVNSIGMVSGQTAFDWNGAIRQVRVYGREWTPRQAIEFYHNRGNALFMPRRDVRFFGPSASGGAIAALASIGFVASGSLSGAGGMSANSLVSLNSTAALSGAAAASGSATISLTGSASASGTGALLANGVISLAGTGAMLAVGDLAGSSTLILSPSAAMSAAGALVGSGIVTLVPSGAILGAGALAGSSSVTLAGTATFDLPAGALQGAGTITLTPAGTVVASASLAGSSQIQLTPSAVMTGAAPISGSAAIQVTGSALLGAVGVLVGSSTISVAAQALLASPGGISGLAGLSLTPQGVMLADGALAGSSVMTLLAVAAAISSGGDPSIVRVLRIDAENRNYHIDPENRILRIH